MVQQQQQQREEGGQGVRSHHRDGLPQLLERRHGAGGVPLAAGQEGPHLRGSQLANLLLHVCTS